jgi:hypothetical protein
MMTRNIQAAALGLVAVMVTASAAMAADCGCGDKCPKDCKCGCKTVKVRTAK